MKTMEILDSRFKQILIAGESLQKHCTGAEWSEGALWIEEYDQVIWSDIPNNRILCWSESAGMGVWKADAEYTNGRYRDLQGNIIHCSHGRRGIEKSTIDGNNFEILVDRYQDKRLNSPNDVVVKSDGTLWFTDPPYGILSNREGHKAEPEQDANYVFCFDPASGELNVVTDFLEEPNGLAFSPDENLLYVSDTSAALKKTGGNHHIVVFDVQDKIALNPRIFAEVSPGLSDGFRLDKNGWIYTSSEDSIQVYHDDGALLGKIFVPEVIANCTFGGVERNVLYIVASSSLYSIKLNAEGIQKP